jgi:isopenicillin-N epimerase
VSFGRREFLKRSAAAGGALVVGRASPIAAATAVAPDYRTWAAVRASFPLSHDAHHFTAFLLSPHPQPVAAAIDRYRRALAPDPDGYLFRYEKVREREALHAAASYLGGSPDEVALTESTTAGLGLLYGGLRVGSGDELLTSTHDFYSTHEALRLKALHSGATLRKIDLYRRPSTASVDEIVSAVRRALRPATRLLALTWVHSSTGVKIPVAEIARALAAVNAGRDDHDRVRFAVDGVHGFGVENVDVAALGCDFFVSGCHKWLYGPRGTGLVWGRRDAWSQTSGTVPSFDERAILRWIRPGSGPPVPPAAALTPGGFHAFEHRWALRETFEFHAAVGRARIAERTHELARQLKAGLSRMPSVILHTPRSGELSSGLVCFEVKTLEATAAVADLKSRGILASVTPYAAQYVRLGTSIVNSPPEVDLALRAVRRL